ncbi:hypothetical protein [Paraburkholderia tropica]|uniref:Uncharacterized protein n=1 Tax=Paraburkholderia tropica TaxID=92647 RepID=A0ABX5MPW5_9BURK|nr:hypothetical protein [Paraburkholderia tropica]MBB2977767.1 Cu/Zn superoxide dismutase [Paraburkholderia tropica]MBB3001071.1 Cu/Zn superoxide dismutase [Paraburkholderia tropica]MBB6319088.1 Cu/Zn superoxide dismutase [Paraburkholderia tropica]MDE1141600.1 hypothetical protein [Paraburkholderia tropica]PXX16490.1 hypothetical protein C7400_108299 [Paraburkholderia tropica]
MTFHHFNIETSGDDAATYPADTFAKLAVKGKSGKRAACSVTRLRAVTIASNEAQS